MQNEEVRTDQSQQNAAQAVATNGVDVAIVADLVRTGLAQGHRPKMTIISNSMAPLLTVGDEIDLEPCTTAMLQRGDIIVLQGKYDMITHRFHQFAQQSGNTWLVTRGDRSTRFDPLWPPSALIGRVTQRQRDKQLLSLTEGRGKHANRLLQQFASAEQQLCKDTKQRTPAQWADADQRLIGVDFQSRTATRFWARAVHLALAACAYVVMIPANAGTTTKPKDNS